MLDWLFGKNKGPKNTGLQCRITSVENVQRGWIIYYESEDGRKFESRVYQVFLNGEMRPEPKVGENLIRTFVGRGDYFPPYFDLLIGNHSFKHYSVGKVEGII